jgi:hypothetical protein
MLNETDPKMLHASPIAHADILDEYAKALSGIKEEAKATTIRKEARKIRQLNPEGYSISERTPYGTHCR